VTAGINENLYPVLQARFPTDPEAPCRILSDGRVVSFGMLQQESARFAGLLTALGVQPGDRVAVQVRKSPQPLWLNLSSSTRSKATSPISRSPSAWISSPVAQYHGKVQKNVLREQFS